MNIHFFNEEVSFSLEDENTIVSWLTSIASEHKFRIESLNYIFCSDEYLLQINQEHLDHNYYTDIITFDNSEAPDEIEGDIFISIDRVKENADDISVSFQRELHRVIAHGLLHLIGFNDKTEADQILMREKEDACLSLLENKEGST